MPPTRSHLEVPWYRERVKNIMAILLAYGDESYDEARQRVIAIDLPPFCGPIIM